MQRPFHLDLALDSLDDARIGVRGKVVDWNVGMHVQTTTAEGMQESMLLQYISTFFDLA